MLCINLSRTKKSMIQNARRRGGLAAGFLFTKRARQTKPQKRFECAMGMCRRSKPQNLRTGDARRFVRAISFDCRGGETERHCGSANKNCADAINNVLHGECRKQHAEQARQHDVSGDAENAAEPCG